MVDFAIEDALRALLGGTLIGAAAAFLLFLNGRIAGISGIIGGILGQTSWGERGWRLAFLAGLIAAPVVHLLASAGVEAVTISSEPLVLVCGGLFVGYGTRLGGGCTSGHGVCGLARFSHRSLLATMIFMVSAALTVFVMRHVLGGSL